MAHFEREPTAQPDPKATRLAWKAWEDLWTQAAAKSDVHLLAQLVGERIDTRAKQDAAELVFRHYAQRPHDYSNTLARLLLTHGAKVQPAVVAELCVCGVRAMKLLKAHGVDLSTTNFAGETGLAMVCLIGDDDKFREAWKYLRELGLDPNQRDDCLETPMDAVEKYGKGALVEQIETELAANAQAMALDGASQKARSKQRKTRL